MKRWHLIACTLLAILLMAVPSFWLGRRLGVDGRLILLGLMVAAWALLHVGEAALRRRMARRMRALPRRDAAMLAALWDDYRYVLPDANPRSLRATLLVGFLAVNGPLLPLLLLPFLWVHEVLMLAPPMPQLAALAAGFGLAWGWWALAGKWWLKWARSRGLSESAAVYHGQRVQIIGARRVR